MLSTGPASRAAASFASLPTRTQLRARADPVVDPRSSGGLIAGVSDQATAEAIEAVWRLESTRLVAGLVRMVRDVGLAEDLAQDAMVAALAQWPVDGIPDNPGAWLMTTAKRRAVDTFRRRERGERAYRTLGQEVTEEVNEDSILAALGHVEDDVLRLMFLCCHPSLTPEARTRSGANVDSALRYSRDAT